MSDIPKEVSEQELRIRAEHKQELARIERDHEREMALLDGQSLAKMPLSLRLIFDDRLRAKVEQAATDMSDARGFTPTHLLGKLAACKVVIVKSIGWNLDPYAVANATYELPGGRVGFEGALYRAIAESSGLIEGEFDYEWYGEWERLPRPSFKMVASARDPSKKVPKELWEFWGEIEHGLGIKVSAKIAATGQTKSINFDLVDAYPRNATTWPTRPKLQIINPATRAFVTLVKPSLLMGVHFRDTVEDAPELRDITPAEQQPSRRQPLAAPKYETLWSAHGEQIQLQSGEVATWLMGHVKDLTGDELDQLVENNEEYRETVTRAVEGELARRGGKTPAEPARAREGGPARQSEQRGAEARREGRRGYQTIADALIAQVRAGADLDGVLASKDCEILRKWKNQGFYQQVLTAVEAERAEADEAAADLDEEPEGGGGHDPTADGAPEFDDRQPYTMTIFGAVSDYEDAEKFLDALEHEVRVALPMEQRGVVEENSPTIARLVAYNEHLRQRCEALGWRGR